MGTDPPPPAQNSHRPWPSRDPPRHRHAAGVSSPPGVWLVWPVAHMTSFQQRVGNVRNHSVFFITPPHNKPEPNLTK